MRGCGGTVGRSRAFARTPPHTSRGVARRSGLGLRLTTAPATTYGMFVLVAVLVLVPAQCAVAARCGAAVDGSPVSAGCDGSAPSAAPTAPYAARGLATAPTFQITVQSDNTVTVLFSAAVTRVADGSTTLLPADLVVSVTGGVATLASFSVAGPTAGAGAAVAYTLTLTFNGEPDGVEVATVDVAANQVRMKSLRSLDLAPRTAHIPCVHTCACEGGPCVAPGPGRGLSCCAGRKVLPAQRRGLPQRGARPAPPSRVNSCAAQRVVTDAERHACVPRARPC